MTSAVTSFRWQHLGAVAPTHLAGARETLHHAAQLLALVGASYVPSRADDSHTSMIWLEDRAAFATQIVEALRPFRVALRPADLTILVVDLSGADPAVFPLGGRTREESVAWLRARIGDAGRDPAALQTTLHFSIADHSTDHREPFARQDELVELGRWYANAAVLLEARRGGISGAGEVRCWPHHFDIATLVTMSAGAFQMIGIGMSPGDASYGEPYFYVSPYPAPRSELAPLAMGRWHKSGWSGAVLRGSEITAVSDGAEQSVLVGRFIDGAFGTLRQTV